MAGVPAPKLRTHGPDRCHKHPQCAKHFDGITTGVIDWCCCCNPCYYQRPWNGGGSLNCRCVPRWLCGKFVVDNPGYNCCQDITQPIFVRFDTNPAPGFIEYSFGFTGVNYALIIQNHEWQFYETPVSGPQVLLASEPIDHKNITCLAPPSFEVTNVVTSVGCTGTFVFNLAEMRTIPFMNRYFNANNGDPEIQEDIPIYAANFPNGEFPCHCREVSKTLCVSGRRHDGGDVEFVEFLWNEGLGDRWQYLPPGGDPSTDREVIYLRGDIDGNCYLELDFEQGGVWTNDWAIPPNSFDLNYPHEIREGMLPIAACGCCIKPVRSFAGDVDTTTPVFGKRPIITGRYVDIHAGPCSRWDYICEQCRCTPWKLCLFGSLDGLNTGAGGLVYFGEAFWDGEKFDAGDFSLIFAKNTEERCVLRAVGVDLNDSDPVRCGPYLSSEMESDYQEYYDGGKNWLWITGMICGECVGTYCGPCSNLCVGPPLVTFIELYIERWDGTAEPYFLGSCTHTWAATYYQRWDLTNETSPLLVCGYTGYSNPITCGEDVFRYASFSQGQGGEYLRITREFLAGPLFDAYGVNGNMDPIILVGDGSVSWTIDDCDPFYRETSGAFPGGFFHGSSGDARGVDCLCEETPPLGYDFYTQARWYE